jgi:hypothetical protein
MPLPQKKDSPAETITPEQFGAEIDSLMRSIVRLTEKVEEFNAALRSLPRSSREGRMLQISECIRARATAP